MYYYLLNVPHSTLQIQRERRSGTGKGAGVAHQIVVTNITAERNTKAVIAGAAPEIIKNTGACKSPGLVQYLERGAVEPVQYSFENPTSYRLIFNTGSKEYLYCLPMGWHPGCLESPGIGSRFPVQDNCYEWVDSTITPLHHK